jgi:hypothetical protein
MDLMDMFFGLLEPSTFSLATVLFIIGFIVYELPRSVKIMDEEYTSGFYPEAGRVFDIIVLFFGLLAVAFLYLMDGVDKVADFMYHQSLMPVFLIILIVVPVFIALGYIKRLLSRINDQESVTIFLLHSFLDLGHTVFFICFSLLFVPVLLYILFSWL